VALAVALGVGACEHVDPPGPAGPEAPAPEPAREPSAAWRTLEESAQVAIEDEALAAALEEASARARRSAEDARGRWQALEAEARAQWAVKWAAVTTDGGTEHLWVLPLTWSAFRIEGVLLSPPRRALRSGRTAGDTVAFPAEELSDWVRIGPDGSREGGFTIDVLEEHLGDPSPTPVGL
jgi:uncharacterized protein YegJ (DUF2314 family)